MRTLELARSISDDLIALRRELHQRPELGLHLPETQRRVLEALDGLDLEIRTGTALSSVVAVLRGGATAPGEGPVVLLRGDMDALPVTEEVDVPYVSRNVGQMHACGHDLHVAALVGAARILHQMRDEVAGDVVFMFQPAEEGPGGAEPMIEEGLLTAAGRPVDAAFALHVMAAEYPKRQWVSRPRALMAAVDRLRVRVVGAGGHGAQPHRALDPVPVLCEIVLAMQTLVTRTVDPFDTVVLTVGRIEAGTRDNIIPDDGELAATLRTFSAETRDRVLDAVRRLATGIAAAHGMRAELVADEHYPATVNDDAEYALGQQTVVDLFGADRFTERPTPEMGSEDMSFVMQRVPGAYFFVSACPVEDHESAPDNHSPRAAFDDSVLADGAAWLAEVALRRLRAGTTRV
jgi:amidohydrolase